MSKVEKKKRVRLTIRLPIVEMGWLERVASLAELTPQQIVKAMLAVEFMRRQRAATARR